MPSEVLSIPHVEASESRQGGDWCGLGPVLPSTGAGVGFFPNLGSPQGTCILPCREPTPAGVVGAGQRPGPLAVGAPPRV